MELGYQIVDKLTKEEYNNYIKEYLEDGKNFSGQSGKESINTISALDRGRNWIGGIKHSADSSSAGQRGKNIHFQQMAGEQIERRKDSSDRGGNLRSGLSGGKVDNTDRISSSIPVKQKFVDITGRHRNVLGIGDGKYMVQDTKKVNYKFNSIEEAISAENENIIQRYARKNNRSVTWVKNKLAEDSDFLARERRKGKASQDLDFFDYLNENAEDAEIAESETIEERELSNREILANMLESVAESARSRRVGRMPEGRRHRKTVLARHLEPWLTWSRKVQSSLHT